MKRFFTVVALLLAISCLLASDLMQPEKMSKLQNSKTTLMGRDSRNAPVVNFALDPVTLATSYQDYMPGAYNGLPLVRQPETAGGGQYLAFMYKPDAEGTSNRKVYSVYIDQDNVVTALQDLSFNDIREGFVTVGMDQLLGNPFMTWHANSDADPEYECPATWDMFNALGSPGFWASAFNLIDNPMEGLGPIADEGEYIWPTVKSGPSPITGKTRFHVYANMMPLNANDTATYNSLYGYADVNYNAAAFELEWTEWTWKTFDVWDQAQFDQGERITKDLAISPIDGQVAFVGILGDSLVAMYSDDYGDTFDYRVDHNFHFPVDNPMNLPVNTNDYRFYDDDGVTPSVMFFQPSSSGSHFNASFTEDGSKIMYMGAMTLNSEENASTGYYTPDFFHPKMFTYVPATDEFTFSDIGLTGANPNDHIPMKPWDLNEDGEVDEYYESDDPDVDGLVVLADVWPSYYYTDDAGAGDASFHHSVFRTVSHRNWVVTMYQDGSKLKGLARGNDDYEGWEETPEIAITVSSDWGETWSEIALLNGKAGDANYHAGLDGMTIAYAYPGDTIMPASSSPNETHGQLPIFFYDDDSWGSFAMSPPEGQNLGGRLMYGILDIEFEGPVGSETTTVPELFASVKNYPNPFNPSTTISYELKKAGNISIEVFNAKGQKVKTLVDGFKNEGTQTTSWNGVDNSGKSVSSGIYFYKLSTETSSTTKKMVLMK